MEAALPAELMLIDSSWISNSPNKTGEQAASHSAAIGSFGVGNPGIFKAGAHSRTGFIYFYAVFSTGVLKNQGVCRIW